jgi:hypothetical protein
MTEYIVKFLAALAAIADGLNNIAAAINKNGLAAPVQQTLELTTETPAKASVSPTLDRLKADTKVKADAAKQEAADKAKADAAKEKADNDAKAKADAAKQEAADKAKAAENPASEDKVDVSHLRLVGTALVAAGKKTEFLAILAEFGAKNVTTVPDDKRAACLDKLEKTLGKKVCQLED